MPALPGGFLGIWMSFFIHAGGGGGLVEDTDLSGLRPLCDLWQVTVSLCDLFSSPVIRLNKSACVSGRGFKD